MRWFNICLALAFLAAPLPAEEIEFVKTIKFKGEIEEDQDVSAVGLIGKYLVRGSDETKLVQVLEQDGANYKLRGELALGGAGKEIDIEAIACDVAKKEVFVLGSHCFNRLPPDEKNTVAENRDRLNTAPGLQVNRQRLIRLAIDATGNLALRDERNLREALKRFPMLKQALLVPSKENGVDFEGLSCDGTFLYAGFRGPVLVGGYALVVKFKYDDPATSELLLVHLEGRGVRDMVRVPEGHLILAGPVGEGPGSYQIYFWDGTDCLIGKDRPHAHEHCQLLGKLPPPDGETANADGKAEGLIVEQIHADHYDVLVVFDGLPEGAPSRYKVPKKTPLKAIPPTLTLAENAEWLARD